MYFAATATYLKCKQWVFKNNVKSPFAIDKLYKDAVRDSYASGP